MGIDQMHITHGWSKKNPYAQRAAEKFYENDLRFDAVSMHFFHSELLLNADDPDKSNQVETEYTERFRRAIELLRPVNVRSYYLTLDGSYKRKFNRELTPKQFGFDFMCRFSTQVLQGLSQEAYYSERAHTNKVNPEGRAVQLFSKLGIDWMIKKGTIDPSGETLIVRPWGEVQMIGKSQDDGVKMVKTTSVLHKLFPGEQPFSGLVQISPQSPNTPQE